MSTQTLVYPISFTASDEAEFEQWHACHYENETDEEPEDCTEFYLYTDAEYSYVVGWCMGSVGQMTYLACDTLSDLYDWLEEQGAEYIPA